MTTTSPTSQPATSLNHERVVSASPGAMMLPIVLLIIFGSIAFFIYSIAAGVSGGNPAEPLRIGQGGIFPGPTPGHPLWTPFISGILLFILSMFLLPGFFTLQPNEARVLILFGRYVGTVRTPGFHWGNPFYANGPRAEAAANPSKRPPAPPPSPNPPASAFPCVCATCSPTG